MWLLGVVAVLAAALVGWNCRDITTADLPLAMKQWKASGNYFLFAGAAGPSRVIWHRVLHNEGAPQRTLICLHGFPTSSYDWIKILPELQQQFDQIILFDLLGFGLSEKPTNHSYTIMEQADIAEALLAHVGVSEVHVLAHDYGDTVGQELLARHNERAKAGDSTLSLKSVCFLNGGLFPGSHRPRTIQKVMALPHIGTFLGYFANYWLFCRSFVPVFGEHTAPTEVELQEMWSLIAHEGGHRLAGALLHYMADRVQYEQRWTDALKQTTVPIRLIDGPADPVSGRHLAERYRQEVPQADVVLLANGIGHYPQLEAPSETVAAYTAFIPS